MTRCTRCDLYFELRRPGDRYCNLCLAEIAKRDARPPEPEFVPAWLRRPQVAKDFTERMA